MFTGIVEELGMATEITLMGSAAHPEDARIRIQAIRVLENLCHGASICVNGVCLTVTDFAAPVNGQAGWFSADVMPQTLRMTTLGDLVPGAAVNLERALSASGRLDGHVVQGHVDGVGTLLSRKPGSRWDELLFALPAHLRRYVTAQGSIAVNGVSLTITHVTDDGFGVALIPTTLELTNLGTLTSGERVNLEVDVLAKYVARMLEMPEVTE